MVESTSPDQKGGHLSPTKRQKSGSVSSKSSKSTNSSRRKAVPPTQGLDFLHVEGDEEVQKQFIQPDNEIVVMYSGNVWKWNKFSMKQERQLVLTNLNVYNFHKKQLKRTFPIAKLAGLTKSLNDKSQEFVMHVSEEYDYRLETKDRDQLIMTLKMAHLSINKDNLPIYGIPKMKNLEGFCTTEKDMKRGISRIPMVLARLYDEDFMTNKKKTADDQNKFTIVPHNVSKQSEGTAGDELDDFDVDFNHRNQASKSSYAKVRSSTIMKNKESRALDADFTFDDLYQAKEESQTLYRRDTLVNASFNDFECISIVGRGTFGKVYLVRKALDRQLFAMKVIRKDVVIQHESLESLEVEKLILCQVNHPFIIGLNYVFQKSYRIYFIMDFIQGGELFKHLTDEKRFKEDKAKFYAAQIALALGYLHSSNIIYRDLKPENILLNKDGYIMLADFGLAKIVDSQAEDPNSFCGTPEYLSPEMIEGTGHDHTLDWWALGILIYEMIIGIPPFYNQNKHQMYQLITSAPIRWPQMAKHGIEVSKEARDLITRMLNRNRHERLGQKDDVKEILDHPWFADLDTQDLLAKKLQAPFVPEIASKRDLQNFDQEVIAEEMKESILPEESKELINKQGDVFAGFGPMEHNRSGSGARARAAIEAAQKQNQD